MKMLPPDYSVLFDYPATYRIVVYGRLARSLSDRLEGMAINQVDNDDGTAVSVLFGELPDQSALAGILYSLYELHMVLIGVEKIPSSELLSQPGPSVNFWADQTTINQGQCATLRWNVNNIQAVWVYPQGEDYTQYPATEQSSQQVCPAETTTYEMRVQLVDGAVQIQQVTITVNQGNPLVNTN